MRYVVETRIGFAWENVWSEDQEPLTFVSEEEAEAEIQDTLDMMQSAWRRGDMSCAMVRDDFRIIALRANGS